jgi:hypothetical protein
MDAEVNARRMKMKMWREKAPEMRSFVTECSGSFLFQRNFVVRKMEFKKMNKEKARSNHTPTL